MFKRSIASCVAAAALSTAVVAPANAIEVKVNDDMCTFTFTRAELEKMGNTDDHLETTISRAEAQEAVKQNFANAEQGKRELAASVASMKEKLKMETDPEKRAMLESLIKFGEGGLALYPNLVLAQRSCAAGKDQSQLSSDAKVALSNVDETPNAAGIGVIVGGVVLGVIGLAAAALPFLAPMLPPQLRALLNV